MPYDFNGMCLTVHGTRPTQITLCSLQIEDAYYRAVLHGQVQDKFGFKPYMTNMEATVDIMGERNVN